MAERSDLSTMAIHLTREGIVDGAPMNDVGILLKILLEQRILGSTTETGFIVGDQPAVCFQDTPPQFLAQNVWYEEKYREQNPSAKVRYRPLGRIR